MPLASLAALQWYGPAMATLVAEPGVGQLVQATPVQSLRAGLTAKGVGDAPLLRPYRMRNAGLSGEGSGALHLAAPKKTVRAGLRVQVSDLSADDVTGAVLEAPVEGGLSLKAAIRILLAQAAGAATGLEGPTPQFRSIDGTKVRISGAYSGGNRTITSLDGS